MTFHLLRCLQMDVVGQDGQDGGIQLMQRQEKLMQRDSSREVAKHFHSYLKFSSLQFSSIPSAGQKLKLDILRSWLMEETSHQQIQLFI